MQVDRQRTYHFIVYLNISRPFESQGPYETTTATATGTSKSKRFNEQNNNSAPASRFFVHFFAVPAQLRGEMAKF